ncbi:MAG: aldehyde dehydrogenase family protein, partial [Streptomyces sp.]
MQAHDAMYIDGAWRPAAAPEKLDVGNPADGTVIATVPAGGERDVAAAVGAA